MTAKPQSFEHHTRLNWFGITLTLLAMAALILLGVNAVIQSAWLGGFILLLIAHVLMLQFVNERRNDLKLQDRIIRLEMQVRLYRLLSDDLRPRIEDLTLAQLIALRFAPDEELEALVRRVLDEEFSSTKEIKRAIQAWRPDTLRV